MGRVLPCTRISRQVYTALKAGQWHVSLKLPWGLLQRQGHNAVLELMESNLSAFQALPVTQLMLQTPARTRAGTIRLGAL